MILQFRYSKSLLAQNPATVQSEIFCRSTRIDPQLGPLGGCNDMCNVRVTVLLRSYNGHVTVNVLDRYKTVVCAPAHLRGRLQVASVVIKL